MDIVVDILTPWTTCVYLLKGIKQERGITL